MNNELLVKLQNKLIGVLDLFSFDNAKMAIEYACKQLTYFHLINTIGFIIGTTASIIALILVYKYHKKCIEKGSETILCIFGYISLGIVLIVCASGVIYEIIETLQWLLCPLIKLYQFLK